ncbi:hypothetical protein E2C01_011600 [Portunus trituberculatus]|uniref:Uncharacterized protein n=1 Tax=Portunus trituberculatus TaxID=210409 RepID=A0A5B7DCA0_PORTR|nr:hypothetical protein [Portunus trituberculatus]
MRPSSERVKMAYRSGVCNPHSAIRLAPPLGYHNVQRGSNSHAPPPVTVHLRPPLVFGARELEKDEKKKKIKVIDDSQAKSLKPSGSSPAILYGLPKVHKASVPPPDYGCF